MTTGRHHSLTTAAGDQALSQSHTRFSCPTAKKDADSPSLSLSSSAASAAMARHLRQHRNSWPTNEDAAAAVAKVTRPRQMLSSTAEEAGSLDEYSDDNDDDEATTGSEVDGSGGDGRHRPSPGRQRRVVARAETQTDAGTGTHTYAVAKVWYRRWEEHVGAARGFAAGKSAAPGPVEMDTGSEEGNTFVHERVWKLVVAWYGVAASHHLDRKHLYFKDEKVFDVCVLSPFSGIVEHRCKRFNRFEEVGYVELQLRRIFAVSPASRRSRLWISEKTPVPRFRQLLFRLRMLNDCIHRDKMYIFALELADLARDGTTSVWPTGEPGEVRGELSRYGDLTGTDVDDLDAWTESIQHGLAELGRSVADHVALAVGQFSDAARSKLSDTSRRLDERRHDAEEQVRALESRAAALGTAEKELADREAAVADERVQLDDDRHRLEEEECRVHDEIARVDELCRGLGDCKVRLDVGGTVYTTSTQTLRRYPNSLLALMFSGRCEPQPERDGTYFIDRDGAHFRYVLNFLRDGSLDSETLPKDRASVRQIICEARYYQLNELVEHLSDLLRTEIPQ